MGVRGLTTYISQNSQHFHEPYKLHDCFLVIDGNSLASKLYVDVCKCNRVFGGDYDKYAASVLSFFALLSKCNITPLVVIDGGYETRKLKTVECRLKAKLQAAQLCSISTEQSTVPVFPLLMKEVFKQTLRDAGVKFVQADFEADYEVAAIGRQLKSPILSQDSDFYVLDVLYIPFSTLNLHVSKARNLNSSVNMYLKCEIFQADKFVKHFGGLNKALLPLMATVLGNDYVSISFFDKLFSQIKVPKTKKMSAQQRRICAVFEWLRKENVDSAKEKIVSYFKKDVRKQISKEIHRSLGGYRHCESDLLSLFELNVESSKADIPKAQKVVECNTHLTPSLRTCDSDDCDPEDTLECDPKDTIEDENSDVSSNCPEEALSCEVISVSEWPEWIKDMFRRGNLPSFIADLYYLQMFFCQPQVEDFSSEDAHAISFPILKVSCGLLLIDRFSRSEISNRKLKNNLICFTRGSGNRVIKLEIEPILSLPCLSSFPSLTNLPSLPLLLKREIILNALGYEMIEDKQMLMLFPDEWILYAMVVVYWGRKCVSPKVNSYHLHSVVLTWIMLGVIDCKLCGVAHDSKCDIVSKTVQTTTTNVPEHLNSSAVKDKLTQVTAGDCMLLVDNLLQFRNMQSKHLRGHKHLSVGILHLFSQLQTCLQQAMALNSLLSDPFLPIHMSSTFSGSLAFSAFMSLHKVGDIESFVKLTLRENSVWCLYESLIVLFKNLLPDLHVPLRKIRKKTKRRIPREEVTSSEEMQTDTEEETKILDKNNKFSLLGMM